MERDGEKKKKKRKREEIDIFNSLKVCCTRCWVLSYTSTFAPLLPPLPLCLPLFLSSSLFHLLSSQSPFLFLPPYLLFLLLLPPLRFLPVPCLLSSPLFSFSFAVSSPSLPLPPHVTLIKLILNTLFDFPFASHTFRILSFP